MMQIYLEYILSCMIKSLLAEALQFLFSRIRRIYPFLRSVRRNWLSLSICLSFCRDNFLVRYSVMFIILNQLSDWLNDWPELYAVSAIFEPCNVEPAVRRENHEIVMIIAHTFCVDICVQLSYEETIDVGIYSIQLFLWPWFINNN